MQESQGQSLVGPMKPFENFAHDFLKIIPVSL